MGLAGGGSSSCGSRLQVQGPYKLYTCTRRVRCISCHCNLVAHMTCVAGNSACTSSNHIVELRANTHLRADGADLERRHAIAATPTAAQQQPTAQQPAAHRAPHV